MADPNRWKTVKELSRQDILFSVAHVPGTQRLFVGSSDGKVYDLDLSADKPASQELAGHTSYVTGLALAGSRLVSGSYDGRLIWWDIESRSQVRSVDAHARWIRRVVATPDGKRVLSVADDMVARVWDAESGMLVHELRGHEPKTPHHFPSMLYAVAVSADGRWAATGDRVGKVVVWDLAAGKQLAAVEAPVMYTWDPQQRIHSIGGVRSLAFSPDGQRLAVGGMGKVGNIDHLEGLARVEVFDWEKNERTHEFAGDTYKGLTERLVFHPSAGWLFATGGDHSGFVKFFDLAEKKVVKQDKAPMHVHDIALDTAGDRIYAVGHSRIVVWEI